MRFAANIDSLPFLRFARGCVGLRRVTTPEIIGAAWGGAAVDGAGGDDEGGDDNDAGSTDGSAADDKHASETMQPRAVGAFGASGGPTLPQSAVQDTSAARDFFYDDVDTAAALALDGDEPRKRCIAVRINQLLLED